MTKNNLNTSQLAFFAGHEKAICRMLKWTKEDLIYNFCHIMVGGWMGNAEIPRGYPFSDG